MPTIDSHDGTPLYYELAGTEGKPWLTFSNSLGTNLHMWDDQMSAFENDYRILRYDSRGHGKSGAPEGAYSIATLGGDALTLLDALGIETTLWCGLSKGGMVGMWLGTNHPERFTRMAYCNTSAHMPTPDMWQGRARTAREQGMPALETAIIDRWFTKSFQDGSPDRVDKVRRQILSTPGGGYAGCCEAIGAMNQRESIRAIPRPVLVIAGAEDPATPPEHGRQIAEAITGASLIVLERAAHLSNIEQTEAFNAALERFLKAA
ncbi:MAG: 3-oxoadipate enol-lactonase [Pseudomonadota bacterium]